MRVHDQQGEALPPNLRLSVRLEAPTIVSDRLRSGTAYGISIAWALTQWVNGTKEDADA
jgi:hypothetical protein